MWLGRTRKRNSSLDDLIGYVDRQVVPVSLSRLRTEIGPMELRYVAVRLLTWLRAQTDSSGGPALPVKIDMKYQWCVNFVRLLEEFQDIGRYFEVVHGGACLARRDAVSGAARARQTGESILEGCRWKVDRSRP